MVERRTPITVGQAIEKVMNFSKKGETEWIPLEQSLSRHLAEDLIADHNIPSFDRSPYDGFAIRAEDSSLASRETPVTFQVIDHIGAGSVSEKKLGKFEAVRIMTGAKIPEGADAVVMLELANVFSENGRERFELKRPFHSGDNISKTGEDTAKGEKLIPRGTVIDSGVVALLATFGYAAVHVVKKPKIGIIATGTELLEVSDRLEPGKIRNSNASMIHAQIREAGGEPLNFGKMADDLDSCYDAVKKAIEKVDFLITTGGVSVGDFDFLPAVYHRLGAKVLFNKVGMRPGSVTTVAEYNGKLLFGLSGNPSACFVGFELFVKPIMKAWLFSEKPHSMYHQAVLNKDFPKANPFTRFVRSVVSVENGRVIVDPVGLDKSSSVISLATANAFLVLPGGTKGYQKGDVASVLMFKEDRGSEWPWDTILSSSK
jgi:molybdopterin molybdotransferase